MFHSIERRWFGVLLLIASSATAHSAPVRGAEVSWIRDSDGEWLDPSNWDTGAIPTSTDVVSITRPESDVTVTLFDGSAVVDRLNSDESLAIRDGSLTVHDVSRIDGTLTLERSKVLAIGRTAHLSAANASEATDVEIEVDGGGSIAFSGLTRLDFTNRPWMGVSRWRARGESSSLRLPELQEVSVEVDCLCRVEIDAVDGGLIQADNLARITGDRSVNGVVLRIGGVGSRIHLPALVEAIGTKFHLKKDGALFTPNLTRLSRSGVLVENNVLTFDQVSEVDASLSTLNGGTLQLPLIQSYSPPRGGTSRVWRSEGAGSRLDLSSLRTISLAPESSSLAFIATDGGLIDLSQLPEVDSTHNVVSAKVSGGQSKIDFSSLSTIDGFGEISVEDGGTLLWNNPSSIRGTHLRLVGDVSIETSQLALVDNGAISVTASELELPNLSTATGSRLEATQDARLSLPSLVEASSIDFRAQDGGVLDVSSLRHLNSGNDRVTVTNGGQMMLSGLQSIRSFSREGIEILVSDKASVLDLSSLSDVEGIGVITLKDGGELRLGDVREIERLGLRLENEVAFSELFNLQAFRSSYLSTQGTDLEFKSLTVFSDVGIGVLDGSVVSMPRVTRYSILEKANRRRGWTVQGSGSLLDMSSMTEIELTDGSLSIDVVDGGRLDVSAVKRVTANGALHSLLVSANGTDSVVDLSSIQDLGVRTVIRLGEGGSMLWGSPTELENTAVSIYLDANVALEQLESMRDSSLAFNRFDLELANLTSFDDSSVEARSGALVALPSLRTYTTIADGGSWVAWGEGARLDLSSLETVRLTKGSLHLTALDGQIDLSGLNEVTASDEPRIKFNLRARSGGRILVPNLTQAEATVLDPESGVLVLTPGTISMVRSSIIASRSNVAKIEVGVIEMGIGTELIGIGDVDGDYINRDGIISPGRDSLRVSFDGNFVGERSQLTIRGNLMQTDGHLLIDVNGTEPGEEVDQVLVDGQASLGGFLKLIPLPQFRPRLGDEFSPLVAHQVLGQFDRIEGVDLAETRWAFAVTYHDDHVRVRISKVGDVDFDDLFDSHDLIQVFQEGKYESGVERDAVWTQGDWNGDRQFDSSDLVYAVQKGSYSGQQQPLPAVPEPAHRPLVWLSLVIFCRYRRRYTRLERHRD